MLALRGPQLQAAALVVVAVLPAAHPLAGETCLPLRALDGERLITVADPHRLRHRIETALARAEARPRGLMAA